MKVKFLTKSKANPQNILIRVFHGKDFDQTTTTGLFVQKNGFSNTYGKIKNISSIQDKDEINLTIEDLKSYILKNYNETILKGQVITKGWLKNNVDRFFNRVEKTEHFKRLLISWAKHYNENETINKETGKKLASNTLKKYKTGLNCFVDFENYRKNIIQLNDIDYSFYKEFVDYCLNEKKYAPNTVGAQIKVLKKWLQESNKRGFSNVDFSDFKTLTNEAESIYLTEDEINQVYNTNFSDNEKLSNVRDIFIIGCRTGLRISDFKQLISSNITSDMIIIKAQKSKNEVVIPLHNQVKEILYKNNGEFPRLITDPKFNLYVKDVCKIAKLNEMVKGSKMNPKTNRKETGIYPKHELVTSHICRRSFATNLYGKIGSATIMGITGHKTEKEFLKYIKTTSKQHAEKLKQHWNKTKNNENIS
jgi:integrase